jgi:hypothetical protein
MEIVPTLGRINPSISDAVARMSRLVGEDEAFLGSLAGSLEPILSGGSAAIAVGALVAAPGPVADRVLRRMAGHVAGADMVDSAAIDRVWSVVNGESPRQDVVAGATASRSGPMLVINSEVRDLTTPGPVDLVPGEVETGGLVFETMAVDGPCLVAPLSRWSALFPAGTPLAVTAEGVVLAEGKPAWVPGERRLPVAWYQPGESGYLVVAASRKPGWTSSL